MTSTLSEKNKNNTQGKSNFMTNFTWKLKSNKKILIIISILQLIGLPLLLTMSVVHIVSKQYVEMGIYQILAVFGLGGATLAGIVIAMNNFSYLYKKSDVDMVYSLPMNTKQRFFSDYLSGLAVYAVPYICSCIITLIIYLFSYQGFEKWRLMVGIDFTPTLLKGMLCGLLIMIMLYTISVLIMTCCGSTFETIMYILLGNAIIPGTIACACYGMFSNLFGINIDNITMNLISYTSPVGGIIAGLGLMDSIGSGISSFWQWLPIYVLVTAIMLIGAYFLYKKRKAEDVSKPFVFKMFYYIVLTASTFCIGCIIPASQDESYVAPVIIMSAIIYMIFEVVTNRGFKKIHFSIIRYVITMGVVIALPYVVDKTDGLGMVYSVPSAKNISSVSVSLPSQDSLWVYPADVMEFDNPEIIQDVIDVQKDVLDKYKNDDEYREYVLSHWSSYNYTVSNDYMDKDIPYFNINIDYHLKNGSVVSRTYYLTNAEQLMLTDTLTDKAYIDAIVKTIDNRIFFNQGENTTKVDVYNKYMLYSNTFDMTPEFINKFKEAYSKDMQEQTVEDVLNSDVYAYFYDGTFPIYKSYKNTIALLKENKYTPKDIAVELKSYQSLNQPVGTNPYNPDNEISNIFLFTPEQYQSFGSDEYTAGYGSFVITDDKVHEINFFENDEISQDIIKLFEVARPKYITTDDCYVMIFNDISYVIPKEYSDIAEKVMKEHTFTSVMDLSNIQDGSNIMGNKQYYDNAGNYRNYIRSILYGQSVDVDVNAKDSKIYHDDYLYYQY